MRPEQDLPFAKPAFFGRSIRRAMLSGSTARRTHLETARVSGHGGQQGRCRAGDHELTAPRAVHASSRAKAVYDRVREHAVRTNKRVLVSGRPRRAE
jgi:hypothetical protein